MNAGRFVLRPWESPPGAAQALSFVIRCSDDAVLRECCNSSPAESHPRAKSASLDRLWMRFQYFGIPSRMTE